MGLIVSKDDPDGVTGLTGGAIFFFISLVTYILLFTERERGSNTKNIQPPSLHNQENPLVQSLSNTKKPVTLPGTSIWKQK